MGGRSGRALRAPQRDGGRRGREGPNLRMSQEEKRGRGVPEGRVGGGNRGSPKL